MQRLHIEVIDRAYAAILAANRHLYVAADGKIYGFTF